MRGASLRWLPLLLLASLPALVSSWHASLGKRAAPIVHATSQRGDLELPRAQDVIDDPCLLVTTSVEKLHSVCNATCATAVPCDWNCKVAWNSFLRDAHSVEGMQCPRYAAFLDETPLGDSLVPALGDALMSRAYLMSLIDKCRDACPEGVDDESLFPCGENYDAQQGSSFTRCQLERDPGLTACFPLSPYKAKCTGGPDSFNVTDGEVWYPLVTWGVVAHYKKKNLASTGGLYGTDKSLGLYGTDKSIEINEYSSWACLWEESCEEMRNKRKMSCFKYSHLRGEFIFWKWSDTVVELKNVYVDVWTVFASFCQQGSFLVIDAFDRGVAIEPEGVKYTFNRMHRDGKYRPAFSGLLADFGEDGCGDFELQRDMPYLLQIQVQEREAYSYFTSLEKWNSPTKSEMQALVQLSSDAIPIVIPVFPKRGIECSSLAFVFSWCITSEIDMDIVLFKPNPNSEGKVFDPDTGHSMMNSKRVSGRNKFQGPNQDDFRVSYSMEIEMEDDGDYEDNGKRSYGPETIYMFGDLDEGVYAVMAYIVTEDPKSTFKGGCETITMYSGMDGRDRSLASVSIGGKAGQGNWWHAFNIRIQRLADETGAQSRNVKQVDYGVVNKVYNGPAVCKYDCGIGGNNAEFRYRPSMQEMMKAEQWKMDGKIVDPRTVRPISGRVDGYRTLMVYESAFQGVSVRKCEMISYVEIRALDAMTNSYLADAKYIMDGRRETIETFQHRLVRDPTGGFIGGYPVRQGVHVFELTRSGYQTLTFTLQVPQVCEGSNCLTSEYVYHEVYMIPRDGKTRFILNWGDVPSDLDIIVKPVGVRGLNGEPMNISWKTGKGGDVEVYDYVHIFPPTSEYGPGREPYASWLLGDTSCACDYTCKENDLTHPFVCTHDIFDPRERCEDYERNNDFQPVSVAGQAPVCYDRSGIAKAACCCNDPDENGVVKCTEYSDAWCCPVAQEVPGSLCSPVCSMQTSAVLNFNTTISIDRDEAEHNTVKPDTDGKYVNRPEVTTLSNLLPGMYKVYANAYAPRDNLDSNTFGMYTSIGIYLGNGKDRSVLVDTITITRGSGKWIYGGYIQVTATQDSCSGPSKMQQTDPVNGRYLCYTWYAAGYAVDPPLKIQYSALHVRIAGASGRQNAVLSDFAGVQYSVHAEGTCSCTTSGATSGCRCTGGSALVHAGVLGPMQRTQEAAEGWAKTTNPIYFPVEPEKHYWLIVRNRGYYDKVYSLGACDPYVWGPIKTQDVVMVKEVDAGELRVILSWSKISDGDIFIFKDPLPVNYELRRRAANEPFVFWDDTEALHGIRLEQDCTTKECGVETVFFSNSARHNGVTYTVAVGVYAGVGQNSGDGKCNVSQFCTLKGGNISSDEEVDFYDSNGLNLKVPYIGRQADADWWLVAKVSMQNNIWIIDTSCPTCNQRAYCVPPSVPSFMTPDCVV